MNCPLCFTPLKKNLLLDTEALISCPLDSCIYPLNMSLDQLRHQRLLVQTSEQEILTQMKEKLKTAEVKEKISHFVTQPEA